MSWRRLTVALGLCLLLSALCVPNSNATNDTWTLTLTSCQVCAATQNCTQAFYGNPGQFCGFRLNSDGASKACCCPTELVCRDDTSECKCGSSDSKPSKKLSTGAIVGIVIGSLFVVVVCIWCFRSDTETTTEEASGRTTTQTTRQAKIPGAAGGASMVPIKNILNAIEKIEKIEGGSDEHKDGNDDGGKNGDDGPDGDNGDSGGGGGGDTIEVCVSNESVDIGWGDGGGDSGGDCGGDCGGGD